MIHKLLTLTRPLFVPDTETTGVDTDNDRIVEIGFEEWSADGMVKEWRTLVNPGVPIPLAATAVHHITDEMVQGCRVCGKSYGDHVLVDHEFHPWPSFKQLAANLAIGFVDCDFAGQNVRFDLRIMAAEMKRAGVAWSYAGARIVDSSRLEALAVPRHLADLHRKYFGKEHDGAHGALSDVRAARNVIATQLEVYKELPRDLDQLHELQWPGWLTTDGGFRMVDGVACIMFGKHRGKALKDVEPSYWDWILKNNFAADAKALAEGVRRGVFPKGKVIPSKS